MSIELYKNFYQKHLEEKAFESLKKATGNENLTYDSMLLNEFGVELNVGNEIKEYISAFGEDLIKDLETIDNKIDEWFFDYKINKTGVNIDKKIDEIKNMQKELDIIDKKITINLENTAIDNTLKNRFIDVFKEKIVELKNSLNTLLSNFINRKNEIANNNIYLDNEMKIELLSNDTLNPKILNTLSKDNNISIIRKVAEHPNTSQATLGYIARQIDDFKVKENLLNNPKTPTEAINKYLDDIDKDIVLKALSHENISMKKLEKFSKSDDTEIQLAVLNNENCTLKILEDIAAKNLDNPKILGSIIEHKNCHKDLKNFLESLSETSQAKTTKTEKTSLKDKIDKAKDTLNKKKIEKSNTTKEHTKAI